MHNKPVTAETMRTSEFGILLLRPVCVFALTLALFPGCATSGDKPGFAKRSIERLSFGSQQASEEEIAKSEFAVASARLAEERNDSQQAMRLYREAINLNPGNADAHWRQAILHARQQDFEEATASFREAVELDKENPALCADYGYHLYLQGDLDQAEMYLRRAVRNAPENQRACNNLGLVLAANGKDDEAVAAFLDAGCSEASARSNLAYAQSLRRETDKAKESLHASLTLDPTNKTASSALRQLEKLHASNTIPENNLLSSEESSEGNGMSHLTQTGYIREHGESSDSPAQSPSGVIQ